MAELRQQPLLEVEARVLAVLITEPFKRALAFDLDVDDFTDYRHKVVLQAIRALELVDSEVGVVAIADELEHLDAKYGKSVSDHAGAAFLGLLLASTHTYERAFGEAALEVFEADLRQLRNIRTAREAA